MRVVTDIIQGLFGINGNQDNQYDTVPPLTVVFAHCRIEPRVNHPRLPRNCIQISVVVLETAFHVAKSSPVDVALFAKIRSN